MIIWSERCLERARCCCMPNQTTNKKPAKLVCRCKRGHTMVKQHCAMTNALVFNMGKFLFVCVAELARLLASELANIVQMQFRRCSWSGNFGQMTVLNLLETINCQSKTLLACKLFIVIFARQMSVRSILDLNQRHSTSLA